MTITKTRVVRFVLDDSGTPVDVTVSAWSDGGVVIDAEYVDDITGIPVVMEELIVQDTAPTVQEIQDAMDEYHDRLIDRWLDSITY